MSVCLCVYQAHVYMCVCLDQIIQLVYICESWFVRIGAADPWKFARLLRNPSGSPKGIYKESDLMNKAQVTLRHTKDIIRCGWRREIQNKKQSSLKVLYLILRVVVFFFSFFTPDGWLLPIWSHGQQQKNRKSLTPHVYQQS